MGHIVNHDNIPLINRGKKLLQWIDNIEDYINMVFLILLVIVVFLQVVTRYLLRHPFYWTEEMSRNLFTWISLLGASAVIKRGGHPNVETLVSCFSPSVRKSIRIIVDFLSCVLYVVVIGAGVRFAWYGRLYQTPLLEINTFFIYVSIPVAGLLLTLRTIKKFRSDYFS
jgi:TRAP-type C4-dicarboxylate transport system permease small subunit